MNAGRWKVACINWPHVGAPHATSYLLVDGDAQLTMYHDTWDEAMLRVNTYVHLYPSIALGSK